MHHRIYKNFELSFDFARTDSYGVYVAKLLDSPEGQAKVEFGPRYSLQQWDTLNPSDIWPVMNHIELPTSISSPFAQQILTPQEWGQLLFDYTFHGDLLRCWIASLNQSRASRFGLRILLRFNDTPKLALLPWEYLYDHHIGGFLALSDDTPIVRYPEIPQGANAPSISEKLCMLVAVAQPNDIPTSLNVDQELADLQYVLKDSRVRTPIKVDIIQQCTVEKLQRRFQEMNDPIHILHFIGHGRYHTEQQEGLLFFETHNGSGDPVTAERLTEIVRNHDSLRLIFLNSCEGAKNGTSSIFSSLASQIVKTMPPTLLAVIAMQFDIVDETAIALTRYFYEAVASGYPVDSALTKARNALFVRHNSYDWGTPALFMRAEDGKLFDISDPVQHPGFQLLEVKDLAVHEARIEAKVSQKLLQILCDNRLLILSEEPQATLQTLAYHLAFKLNRINSSLSIREWQKDPEQIDFKFFFPLQEKISRAPDNTIFILPEVSQDLLIDQFLTELIPSLAQRQQYLILTTTTSRNILDQNKTITRLWSEPEKTIYNAKYLSAELEQKLKDTEKRLPERLLIRLKEGQPELGYSLKKIAIQLKQPVYMDAFVERLCNDNELVTKEYIQGLIQNCRAERDEDRIRYLYYHLPQRRDQLLVVGLCIFGGVTETQFFQLLERVIKSNWQYAFAEIEILDYYHLHHLRLFFRYDEQDAKQYSVERNILPRYTNQWWHLLLIIWESHRNHLRKIFPELAAIVIDSVTGHRNDYGNVQQRQRLRDSIGNLFSNVGRISLPSIEDTLLDLASYRSPSIQAVVAGAVARWYDKNEKIDAREQLFNLIHCWLSIDWGKESNWKSNQRELTYIRLTVARTLNQILDKVTGSLPDPLPNLLLDLLDNNDKVLRFFYSNISRKIFPNHTPYLIEHWQNDWERSTKASSAAKRLQTINIIAPLCKRYNQLQLIGSWLVDILGYGIKECGNKTIIILQQRRYLIKAVFPAHLPKLSENGALLYLALCGNFETDILEAFLEAHRSNPRSVQAIVDQWLVKWSSYVEQIKELTDQNWYNVLSLVGKFYDDIDQFNSFQAWLPHFIEESDINTQSQVVDLLFRIEVHQRVNLESIQPNSVTLGLIQTDITRNVYLWLCDEQKGSAFHLIAFWFSAKALNKIDRRSMHRNMKTSFYLKRLIPFIVAPVNRRYRIIVGNLLPTMDGLFQYKPEEISEIITHWTKSSSRHVQQVSRRLRWALWLCKFVRVLQYAFSRASKL